MRISGIPLCHVARIGVYALGVPAAPVRVRGTVRAADDDFDASGVDRSDLSELGKAPRSGGDQSALWLVSQRDAARAGVLFVAAAARA
ncbi:hypothetical protein ABZT02_13560 [Streptomyces sp. NPDC005402]|uniref:hypothetical protein n=1 Tax=Streptomyces sp. NPDC005402 TaxID=3155338 RepID=UPI0033AD4C1B